MSDININMPVLASSSSYEQEEIYKECRRNHAASLGRVAYDGCLEFMEGGLRVDDNTRHNMLCAACNCHRSFHSKITIYTPITQIEPHNNNNTVNAAITYPAPPGFRVQQLEGEAIMATPVSSVPSVGGRKKRTMFTREQKNRMMEFAGRLGWRPQKDDKDLIQGFCNEMGISRRMFMVWLSNNRRRAMQLNNAANQPSSTPPPPPPPPPPAAATATAGGN